MAFYSTANCIGATLPSNQIHKFLPGLCLVKDRFPDLAGPDRVAPVIGRFLVDADRIAGAECETAVAGNAPPGIGDYDVVALLAEDAVRTVLHAPPAFHAPLGVDLDLEP